MARHTGPLTALATIALLAGPAACGGERADEVEARARQPASTDVSRLVDALREGDVEARRSAARELGTLGRPARPAVPALIEALRARDWRLRATAAAALVRIEPDPERIVPPLIETFAEDGSSDYRSAVVEPVVRALATLGAGPVPYLRGALGDSRFEVRMGAAYALGELGRPARPALPTLEWALDDPNPFVATTAALAIEQIDPGTGPDRTRPFKQALVERLGSPDPMVRLDAAVALRDLGPSAALAVPALIKRLDDPRRAIQIAAIYALAAIGPDAAAAVPALTERLDAADEGVRDAARRALETIDREPHEGTATLSPSAGPRRSRPHALFRAARLDPVPELDARPARRPEFPLAPSPPGP